MVSLLLAILRRKLVATYKLIASYSFIIRTSYGTLNHLKEDHTSHMNIGSH